MGGYERETRGSPHCMFKQIPFNGKTKKWAVHSTHVGHVQLAVIKWHGAWHKYVTQYLEGTMMDKGCHKEVDDFIDEQMRLRKEARKKNA
jgi:hypothetical protein